MSSVIALSYGRPDRNLDDRARVRPVARKPLNSEKTYQGEGACHDTLQGKRQQTGSRGTSTTSPKRCASARPRTAPALRSMPTPCGRRPATRRRSRIRSARCRGASWPRSSTRPGSRASMVSSDCPFTACLMVKVCFFVNGVRCQRSASRGRLRSIVRCP